MNKIKAKLTAMANSKVNSTIFTKVVREFYSGLKKVERGAYILLKQVSPWSHYLQLHLAKEG